jgi:hypothetical protein
MPSNSSSSSTLSNSNPSSWPPPSSNTNWRAVNGLGNGRTWGLPDQGKSGEKIGEIQWDDRGLGDQGRKARLAMGWKK